jgi:uncharacterized radical SAM superfamily protein
MQVSRYEILGKLSPYTGTKIKVASNQSTVDIIKEILYAHKKFSAEYDKIAPQFWRGSLKSSLQYVFNFLKTI